MTSSLLDQTVCQLQLLDPAQTLSFTGRMLCENVLVSGGVGSGKTSSVINPMLRDAIQFHADDPDTKCGLFVFDSKTDGTTERVRKWAADCGRARDVIVLEPGSSEGYDPFGGVNLLVESDLVAAKIKAGFDEMGEDNQYWHQTSQSGLEAALTMRLIDTEALELQGTLRFIHDLLVANTGPRNRTLAWERIDDIEKALVRRGFDLDQHSRNILDMHVQTLQNWKNLDPKTKGILNTCVGNMLAPLMSHRIQDYFPIDGRTPVCIQSIVDMGKILVLKVNAAENADIAATLGRMIKSDIYRSLQQRQFSHDAEDRLVGLFLDEYPLVATANEPFYGDVQNLQTLREKRGFVVAATQGYISLVNKIGAAAWEGLRINLTNVIYLRSHEPQIESHARTVLGDREVSDSVRLRVDAKDTSTGGVATTSSHERQMSMDRERPIIGRGALARCEVHEGFYSLADGQRSEFPVFFVPLFEKVAFTRKAPVLSALDIAATILHEEMHGPKVGPGDEGWSEDDLPDSLFK
jgi:hypothetical protein